MDDYPGDTWESRLVEFSDTTLGKFPMIMAMFNGKEDSILAERDKVLRDIDLIYTGSPGARYICGADIIDGSPTPDYSAFAEYDGNSKVTFHNAAPI